MVKQVRLVRSVVVGVVLTLAGLLLADPSAWAAKSFRMGVVDPQTVMEKSRAGKRALANLKQYADARQKILQGDQEELQKLDAELNNGPTISDADKRNKQEKFRLKLQAYQKRAQEFNAELSEKQKDLINEYMKKISVATKAVAEKKGLDLVVEKGSSETIKIVIYSKKSIDVTNLVLREFNRRYK